MNQDFAQADRQRLIREACSLEQKRKDALRYLGDKWLLAPASSFDPRHPPVLQKQ